MGTKTLSCTEVWGGRSIGSDHHFDLYKHYHRDGGQAEDSVTIVVK